MRAIGKRLPSVTRLSRRAASNEASRHVGETHVISTDTDRGRLAQ
jgi:hypothetical protein